MNFKFVLLLSLLFALTRVQGNSSIDNLERRIVFFNVDSIDHNAQSNCVGLMSEDKKLFTSSTCMKLISHFIEYQDVRLVNLENYVIGTLNQRSKSSGDKYFYLGDAFHYKKSKFDNTDIELSVLDSEQFYILFSNGEVKWMPVTLSKSTENQFYYSQTSTDYMSIDLGSPVINDKGVVVCFNKGGNLCELFPMNVEYKIQLADSGCTISKDPFPCVNATWEICDYDAKVAMGQCYRKYDQTKCNITINGHSLDTTGTIACKDCSANWDEKNNKILAQNDYPDGCMSHHVMDWRGPLLIAGGVVTGATILIIVTTIAVGVAKKWRVRGYSQL